jgi:hypothetical protein
MPKPKPKSVSKSLNSAKEIHKAIDSVTGIVDPTITASLPEYKFSNKQRVHFFSISSSSEGGYDQGLNALIKDGKTIVCMQLTREHLIVITN